MDVKSNSRIAEPDAALSAVVENLIETVAEMAGRIEVLDAQLQSLDVSDAYLYFRAWA